MDTAQEEKLKRVFTHYDQDKSGTIDLKELQAILNQVGITLDADNASVLVRRYDDDKNGRLSFDEFVYVLQPPSRTRLACSSLLNTFYIREVFLLVLNLKKQFQVADADNSRNISAKEMSIVIQQLKLKVSPKAMGKFAHAPHQ